jgi:hypothetical protein
MLILSASPLANENAAMLMNSRRLPPYYHRYYFDLAQAADPYYQAVTP